MSDHFFSSAFSTLHINNLHAHAQANSHSQYLTGPVRSYHSAEDTPDSYAGTHGGGGYRGHASARDFTGGGGRAHAHAEHGRFSEDAPYLPPRERERPQFVSPQALHSQTPQDFGHHEPRDYYRQSVGGGAPEMSPPPPPYYPINPHAHSGMQSMSYSNPPVAQSNSSLQQHAMATPYGFVPNPYVSPPQMPIQSSFAPEMFHSAGHTPTADWGPTIRQSLGMPDDGRPLSLWSLPDPPPGERPTAGYPALIKLALYGSPKKMLALQEIYAAIEERFPFYRQGEDAPWKRSIRHALSLNLVFKHVPRPVTHPGKGGYWKLDYSQGEGYKRERKRRQVPRQAAGGEGDVGKDDDEGSGSGTEEYDNGGTRSRRSGNGSSGGLRVNTTHLQVKDEASPSPTPSSSSSSGGMGRRAGYDSPPLPVPPIPTGAHIRRPHEPGSGRAGAGPQRQQLGAHPQGMIFTHPDPNMPGPSSVGGGYYVPPRRNPLAHSRSGTPYDFVSADPSSEMDLNPTRPGDSGRVLRPRSSMPMQSYASGSGAPSPTDVYGRSSRHRGGGHS